MEPRKARATDANKDKDAYGFLSDGVHTLPQQKWESQLLVKGRDKAR